MRVCVCVCCVVGKIFSLTHRIYKHSQNHQKEIERARVHPQSYHCSTLNGYDVDVVVFITISNTPFGWLALFFGWTNTVIETQLTHLYTNTRTPFIILSFCCCWVLDFLIALLLVSVLPFQEKSTTIYKKLNLIGWMKYKSRSFFFWNKPRTILLLSFHTKKK